MMTPMMIEMLIHFAVSRAPYDRIYVPACKAAAIEMSQDGLLEFENNAGVAVYRCTDKGRAHLSQLCAVPYPEQRWVTHDDKIIEKD